MKGPARNDRHFDRIAKKYAAAADSMTVLYRQCAEITDPLVQGKTVLDVGNGGKFAYDIRLPSRIIVMDVAANMLDRIHEPDIEKIVGDARSMDAIPDESVDIIVLQLVLHHITGSTAEISLQFLGDVLGTASRKLRSGGSIVITEPVLSGILFNIERLCYRVVQRLLKVADIPMIFFYSRQIITQKVATEFGLAPGAVGVTALPVTGWIDPLAGSFPGIIRIPASFSPSRFVSIVATRP